MPELLKSVFFLIGFSLVADSCGSHLTRTDANTHLKKINISECEEVLFHLSNIWNRKDDYCPDEKNLLGLEIEKLVVKEGCFVGKPFNVIIKYLGKPDFVRGDRMEYDISNHKTAHSQGNHISSIIFEISKDSLIIGCTTDEVSISY